MKTMIFKKRWKKSVPNIFVEFGFDPDNNQYLMGISTEIENEDGVEIRKTGCEKLYNWEIYVRIWILNYELSLGTGEVEICYKSRKNLKILFGLAGNMKC